MYKYVLLALGIIFVSGCYDGNRYSGSATLELSNSKTITMDFNYFSLCVKDCNNSLYEVNYKEYMHPDHNEGGACTRTNINGTLSYHDENGNTIKAEDMFQWANEAEIWGHTTSAITTTVFSFDIGNNKRINITYPGSIKQTELYRTNGDINKLSKSMKKDILNIVMGTMGFFPESKKSKTFLVKETVYGVSYKIENINCEYTDKDVACEYNYTQPLLKMECSYTVESNSKKETNKKLVFNLCYE